MSSTPKLRVLAGPNGSGKSTLLDYLTDLSHRSGFPLGFVLNPDDLERELSQHGRLYLGNWAARATNPTFDEFVTAHPLYAQLEQPTPRLERASLVAPVGTKLGYFVPVICDYLRLKWLAARESFTFETVF